MADREPTAQEIRERLEVLAEQSRRTDIEVAATLEQSARLDAQLAMRSQSRAVRGVRPHRCWALCPCRWLW